MPTVWIFSNLDICPSPEIGNKFQPSLIMRVMIVDYITEMMRRNVKALSQKIAEIAILNI
jgi:hypothetical protein